MSGWPSGLRRCVQVAVSPGGVGSNPTPDKPAFWPAGQTRPSSTRHCLAAHTPRLPPPAPPPQEPSVLLSASFLPSWLQLQLLVFLPPRLPLAHPRPPSPTLPLPRPRPAPGRTEARSPAAAGKPSSRRRRSDFCRGTANSLSQPCLHVRPRPLSLRPAPCPPHPPRRPACAPQSHRGGRAPALPARGVLRALDASAPCGLGRATPACRPPGTRASQPSCWPANTGLPGTSPSREGCSSGEGAEALRARAARPPAPGRRPRPSRGKPLPGPEPSPSRARSLPQPAVPEPGAALPKGPSSPAPPPRQSRTSGARSARAHEPGSHAFGSGPGGR